MSPKSGAVSSVLHNCRTENKTPKEGGEKEEECVDVIGGELDDQQINAKQNGAMDYGKLRNINGP